MAQIQLILREDVEKLGRAGDLVSVKPGFARNFLLPQGKATLATEARVSELDHNRRVIAERQARELKDLQALKHKIESTVIEVTAQAGLEGKLFGSVTLQQVAELLKGKGIEIDRRKMRVPETIKTVGKHVVEVRLHRELSATLNVVVASDAPPPAEALLDSAVEVPGDSDAEASGDEDTPS